MHLPTPSIEELRIAFGDLSRSRTSGVQGVEQWKGTEPGPRVAITAHTHGNEPSGLAPYWYLKNVAEHIRPVRGSLTFIVNNIEATRSYFQAVTDEDKRRSRFVDVNMNRLPDDVLDRADDPRYEIRRARELYPLFRDIDVAMDIHSTAQDSEPMILQIKGEVEPYTKGLSIPVAIDGIVGVQIGIPACSLYGGLQGEIPVFEIEAGWHEQPEAFRLAVRSALVFLLNTGIVDRTEELESFIQKTLLRKHYNVVDSVLFPDESYALTGEYQMFTPIRVGEVLATGNGPPILSPIDGHAIFAPGKPKPVSIAEEVLFLTEPVVETTVLTS